MSRSRCTAALGVALVCLVAGPAKASPEEVANDIAAKVMSPFCPGVTLENCPSDKAVALRDRIESWAERGWDEDRIMAELVDLYGDPIRATPPASGSGLWAWLAPALALGAGAILAGVLSRRWTRRAEVTPEEDDGSRLSAETRARLNEELDALRGRP